MTDLDSPDKVIMQAIEALLPILTGAVRGTLTDLLDAEYARGVAEERARVVAWLQECAEATHRNCEHKVSGYVEGLVEAILGGEHDE